ncbi:MAG: hypothetical protein ACYDC9_08990 [Dermatophilaceae bacterium]
MDLRQTVTDRPGPSYFLSGAPGFIRETAAILVDAGIPARQVKKDMIRGY